MKVRLGISMTLNMGNFESVRPTIEVEEEVREGETPEAATDRIQEATYNLFRREVKNQVALLRQLREDK